MTSTTARSRWWGVFLAAAAAAVLTLGTAAPASAHAQLVSTTPQEGDVLDAAPEEILLTFNEPVLSVPEGVTVFDAAGDVVASSAATRDTDLVVTLDTEVADGTLVVAWRVVSADGHPIAGSLTFSVGAPSESVAAPGADQTADGVPIALSITRAAAYLGLLLSVGLLWFGLLVARGSHDGGGRRTRLAAAGAAVAAVGWMVGLPLTGAYQRGVGLDEAFASATWQTLPGEEYLVSLLVSAGVLGALMIGGRTGALAGLVAVSAPALTGHTRAAEPVALSVLADALHLVAGAIWLGGLVGLALTLPGLAAEPGARLIGRFSTLAAGALATLVAAGSFMAWRIVESWAGLVDTGYGQLLLVKVAIAAVAVAIAAGNRFVLLPRARAGGGVRALHRAVAAEAVVLVAVLSVTGFLVNKSPEGPPSAADPAASTVQQAPLGDLSVLATLTPGESGQNQLSIQLQDAEGEPAEGSQAPVVSVSSHDVDLGDVALRSTGAGTYSGEVLLPTSGEWQVQVSLRLDEFTNPVGVLSFDVG
ncbi:copper resistance CopC/CopD family protein [Nocardioides bigeumensis]|uniref:copper resistance CopC/CopD family protein n=1 Tax=Nocardioides bigeumensis TaxID=433657 RepID=UPI0031E340DC